MEKTKKIKTANLLRNFARYSALVLGMLIFIFALLSGAEEYGGGIRGIIKNSPNAMPWLIFLALVYLTWKRELTGGIIITIFGLAALYFFIFKGNHFFISTFILTLLIILIGVFFIVSWYLRKEEPA